MQGQVMTDSENSQTSAVSQGDTVYNRLLDEVRAGRLTPGERLRETELAERLGVSRTPIREAIRQLEADGIVAHVPRIGASIRVLEYSEVMELYEMRAVLESTAARLAARAASDIEIDELYDMNRRLEQTEDGQEAFVLNRQFHAALLDAAKNRFLVKSTVGLQKTLMILGPSTLIEPARAQSAVKEHYDVLDAIKARDGVQAEAAMRTHIEAAQRVRVRALRGRSYYDGDLF